MTRTRRRRQTNATFERNYHLLEPRVLLAVDTFPADITGTEGVDIIEVVVSSDLVRVTVNNDVTYFDPSAIDRIVIDGLQGRDRISVIDSAFDDNQVTICPDSVRVDGLVDIFAKNVGDIVVQAGEGRDVVRLNGSGLNEDVIVEPNSTFLNRPGFTSRAVGFDETFVVGNGGAFGDGGLDQAFITDTSGEETLIVGANDARLFYPDSFVAFSKFDNIYATFSSGNDLVAINGSSGNDSLFATPELARMFIAESQTTIRTTGFGRLVANGGGGIDQIDFIDSSLDDRLLVRPGFASLATPFATIINASDFENIVAFANNGGRDVGTVFDSNGNDAFHAGPQGARMIGSGYSVNLINFEKVDAIASEGNDQASISNFEGSDRFLAGHGDASFHSSDARVTLTMTDFDRVIAAGNLDENDTAFILGTFGDDKFFGTLLEDESGISTSALLMGSGTLISLTDFVDVQTETGFGTDTNSAYLRSSTSNGIFTGSPENSSITGPRTINGPTRLTVKWFDKVIGTFDPYVPSSPSTNIARVNGSDGDDQLYARRHFGILNGTSLADQEYSIVVQGADLLSSNGKGGSNSAILQDTDDDETVFLNPDQVRMQALDGINSGGYDIFANAFQSVIVNTSGGYDQASLSGSNGNDIFFVDSTRSSMRGDGYYLQGLGFESSGGNALTGSKDIAYIYDSRGNDAFSGDGDFAILRGPRFVNRALGFDEVHAVSFGGGFDTLTVGEIDYQLFRVGNWN